MCTTAEKMMKLLLAYIDEMDQDKKQKIRDQLMELVKVMRV